MNQEFEPGTKEQMESAKKNLVYVGILSIVMLFGAFTSAYIVSMGDTFWLKFPLPSSFWVSTLLIILSSIAVQIAVVSAKKGNLSSLKMAISITLILGLGFVYFQFKGYGQLIDNGVHAASNHIIVTDGKYGDYYEVKMNGKFIEVNGNDFQIGGKNLTDEEVKSYQEFMSQFLVFDSIKPFEVTKDNNFELYFENRPMWVRDNQLLTADSTELKYLDRIRLKDLAVNVRDKRGDFFVRGEMGKDFHIYYKGKELQYKDRDLQMNGTKLSNYLQIKAMESSDTASSYLYMITFLHLVHLIIALFYMMKLVIRSYSGKINAENTIGLKMGAIFCHFLGFLWVYLLLFLLYIH
jgi:cytochrome c oxidase subunit 3